MKKVTFVLLVLFLSIISSYTSVFAIKLEPKESRVQTSAQVGEYYLYLSGIIAPYASVAFISGGNVYTAVTANGEGRFVFLDIRINRGFSNFCLDAVDWRRLGESYTCFSIDPASSDINMQDVFLPPTIGLNHKEIIEGGSVAISGYSMPEAQVEIYINNIKKILYADNTGYYSTILKDVKQGKYELYAGAKYENKESLLPTKRIVLIAIASIGYFKKFMGDLFSWIVQHPYFFIAPSLLLLVLIVIVTIWWDKIGAWLHLPWKKLHHSWFVGY